jgi:hypothetical protein
MDPRKELQAIVASLPQAGLEALGKIAQLWPVMDEISKDSQRDFFARLTDSWIAYSRSLSAGQKEEMMDNLSVELQTRARGLTVLYGDRLSSPSTPPETTR